MNLCMTKEGASEQLVNVNTQIDENSSLRSMSDAIYGHMKRYCDYKKEEVLAQSEYAIITALADFSIRDDIDNANFELHYKQATESIGRTYDPTRLSQANDYGERMLRGDEFPPPILMFKLGTLIQVDGARRIIAMALLQANQKLIIIVVKRRDIKLLLEPDFIKRISDLHQTKKWFNAYQEIIELGLAGKRSYSGRFPSILDFSLFKGKTVVEFACSNGMAMLEAYYRGATRVIGFEFVQQNVDIINLMATRLGIPIEAHRIDFNETDWLDQVKRILPQWDYSIYLSTYRTLELKDRDGLVRGIWNGSTEGMIFEGHQQDVDTDEFYRNVFSTKAALTNYEVTRLPQGIIERPYDASYRHKYLLTRIKS